MHLSFLSTTTKNLNFLVHPLRNFNFLKDSYKIIVKVKVFGYYQVILEDIVFMNKTPLIEVSLIPEKIKLISLLT